MKATVLFGLLMLGAACQGAAAEAVPKTLTIAQAADADTFDPSDIGSTDTLNIARYVWGTLYRVSDNGDLEPYLANSYHLAEDGASLTFKLKPGLKCEDGEPLTAKDVAYSFDRVADPKLKFTGNSSGFVLPALQYAGARVDDDLTVTLLLKKYNPIAVGLISEILILCKAPYEHMTREQAATRAVGSGPYRLADWQHDDRIVLERNKNFTLPTPSYDRIVWRIIPEGSTRSAELIAGNVDIATNVAPDQIDAINAGSTARVESIASTRRIYVGFNQKDSFAATPGGKAIRNPAVRQALQYAVDVPTLCQSLLRTPCTRAATMVNPKNDTSGIAPFPYDPDRAEKLLDAAGYPRGKDGIRFSITLQAPRGRYLDDADMAQAVGQYLTDIGVETKVEVLDFSSVFAPLIRRHDAGPLFMLGTGGATWSALYDLSDLTSATSGTNYTGWDDPEFFAGWRKLEQTKDLGEQRAVVNRMLQIFHDRGPWLLMYFQPDIYGVSKKISWQPRADEVISLQ
jgi:peptide/nickel transport system substrate-binding protein